MYKILLIAMCCALLACDSKPKVIVEDASPTDANATSQTTASNLPPSTANASDMHQVIALDVMHTDKYSYLQVVENTDTFWIAATKFDAKKGSRYFYRGGLMKTNFFSQEFNKTFDKIFLVSSIVDASAHPGTSAGNVSDQPNLEVNANDIKTIPGAINLKDLFKNKAKYEGKPILVTGKVVKVNNGIMNKNWVHLQDGSTEKGKPIDLTVTTQEIIPLGAVVTMEGKIVLNKDFGAGYKYDILLEDAGIKK